MTGHRTRVASQVFSMESSALFTHLLGHSLNLAVCDTIKQCKLTRYVLDVTHEKKLVKISPKCNAIFDKIKKELSPNAPSFRVLCPMRWTVCVKSLQSVLDNYGCTTAALGMCSG